MSTASRSAKLATLCFGLIAVLVLGGLTWASLVSLRLRNARTQADLREEHQRQLRLALWRIDPLVMNVFAKEASRPYWEYASYYLAPKALLSTGEDLTGRVMEPSPLLDRRNVEQWILLHFHLSPRTGWSSPQIPIGDVEAPWDRPADSDDSVAREALLASLARSYGYADFAENVAQGRALAQASCLWSIGEGQASVVEDRPAGTTAAPPRSDAQSLQTNARSRQPRTPQPRGEPRSRAAWNVAIQEALHPPEVCDPLYVALSNLDNGVLLNDPTWQLSAMGCVSVTVSPMTPLWLTPLNADAPTLAMVRTVEAEGYTVYQGFLVDWSALSARLLEEIHDLFPSARLEIVEPGSPCDPEVTLASIPVRLATAPVALTGRSAWQGLDNTLLFAWGAALLALAAVGLGIRSLLVMSERRSQFAYAVTHELRTPLTTLCLYTDMLSEGLVPPDRRDSYIEALRSESQRLSELVSGILEYSRVENRTLRLNTRDMRVDELIHDVTRQCEERCRRAGLTLQTDLNGLGERTVRTDAQLVTQILGNLIDNACKYAAGGRPPRVVLRAAADRHMLRLDVEDNGPGIRRRDRRVIFRPFRRGRSDVAAQPGGIGLGLALARSWARLLGGRLKLRPPTASTGACFSLTLPAPADPPERAASAAR